MFYISLLLPPGVYLISASGADELFIDYEQQVLHVQGVVGCAIGWGPWAGAGMAATDPDLSSRLLRQGRVVSQMLIGSSEGHKLLPVHPIHVAGVRLVRDMCA